MDKADLIVGLGILVLIVGIATIQLSDNYPLSGLLILISDVLVIVGFIEYT